MLVKSTTNSELYYEVSETSCSCKSFFYRRVPCKHMKELFGDEQNE